MPPIFVPFSEAGTLYSLKEGNEIIEEIYDEDGIHLKGYFR